MTLAAACGDEETGGGGPGTASAAEQLCSRMQDYLDACGASTPCDQALVDDCSALVGILNDSLLQSAVDCIDTNGSPLSCLVGSVGGLQPTETHLAVAAKICDVCTGGFGVDECMSVFFSETSDLQLGIVLLPLSDDVVQKIGDDCVSDLLSCGTLVNCAGSTLLAQGLPENTADCLVDNLSNPSAVSMPECTLGGGGAGTGGSGTGGSGTGGSGTTCNPAGSWAVTETLVQSDCPTTIEAPFTLNVTADGDSYAFDVQYDSSYPCSGSSSTEGGTCSATFSCDFPQGQGLFSVDFEPNSLTGSEVYHVTDMEPACFMQVDLAGTRQ
ncbi:MAG: hypothetical protein DRI90_19880 [Deltaproteobacteria bacterium]|nr:MAG: hypothetical protein DRI90_19880 [Deltaproteobacteria bacterium]